MASIAYEVHLDQFEGPLDLLLYFIRRDKIDINNIPIAKITSEYLQFIEDMKALNLSSAGEFVLMAATLMNIKSKMLLPRPDLDDLGEPIDPRTELVNKLMEYRRFKDISDELSSRWESFSFLHERQLTESIEDAADEDVYLKDVSLFDLAKYFKEAVDRMPKINSYELSLESISVNDKKKFIINAFNGDSKLTFKRLLSTCEHKLEIVITFIAILDLVQLFKIAVYQTALFEDIEIHLLSLN